MDNICIYFSPVRRYSIFWLRVHTLTRVHTHVYSYFKDYIFFPKFFVSLWFVLVIDVIQRSWKLNSENLFFFYFILLCFVYLILVIPFSVYSYCIKTCDFWNGYITHINEDFFIFLKISFNLFDFNFLIKKTSLCKIN